MGAWRSLRQPTVAILLLASVVHVVRRDLFDLLLFSGTAVLILLDAGRADRLARAGDDDAAPTEWRRTTRWVIAAGVALFAMLAAVPSPASLGAVLVLALIGLAALVLVLVRPPRAVAAPAAQASRGKLPGWQVWAVIGVAACLWELASFISQQVWPAGEDAHPAVSDLVGPLLTGWPGRAVFLLLWAGAGWWLLRQWIAPAPGRRAGQDHGRLVAEPEDSSEVNR